MNPIKCYIGNSHFYLIHFEELVNFVFLLMSYVWFFQFEFDQTYYLILFYFWEIFFYKFPIHYFIIFIFFNILYLWSISWTIWLSHLQFVSMNCWRFPKWTFHWIWYFLGDFDIAIYWSHVMDYFGKYNFHYNFI